MKVNKNTEVSKTLNDVEDLATLIKEGTKKTLKDILTESVSEYMKESILNEDEEEDKDKANPIEDSSDDSADDSATEEGSDADDVEDTEPEEEEVEDDDNIDVIEDSEGEFDAIDDAEGDGNEWDEFEDYKVGDDEYDFTGVNDANTIAKVFKLMKNDDEVSVKQDGDRINFSDNAEGTEYVIELNPETEEENNESMNLQMTEGTVNLGYTDNYQDKDPIAGLTMSGEDDWGSKGAPKGTKKPWAGKGNMKPYGAKAEQPEKVFEITLNDEFMNEDEELDEASMSSSTQADRKMTKSNKSSVKHLPQVSKEVSVAGNRLTTESVKRQLNAVMKENKELKSLLQKVKKSLVEAVQVNLNLGNITRLVTENSTTKAEKEEIIKKFNNAKTPAESKALYESFSATLKKVQPTNIVKENVSLATGSTINETTVYENESANEVLSFMERMAKC